MNFKHGIGVALTVFIIFITALAMYLNNVGAELTTEDYYSKDLNFQQQLNARQFAANFDNPIEIKLIDHNHLEIFNKSTFSLNNFKLFFYRANDKKDDLSLTLSKLPYRISFSTLKKGKYSITIDYDLILNNKSYSLEQLFNVVIP